MERCKDVYEDMDSDGQISLFCSLTGKECCGIYCCLEDEEE